MSEIEELETAKKKIDELKIKNIANSNEKKRLEGELEKITNEIKSTYGVDIKDFNSAIEVMEKEQSVLLDKLRVLIQEASEKLGVE